VRLTGCPLRCQYCDTAYAFSGGENRDISDILLEVEKYHPRYVTVTGGEPLAQPACLELLRELCDQNYIVSLETSGALDVSKVDPRVVKVLDIKTPGSLESNKNLLSNFDYLLPHDQIKFVICNRLDYDWSKDFIEKHRLFERADILFSPSFMQIKNEELAEWILKDRLPVRFQLQMHKYIWGDVQGK
jgi:7-carboxy-7-deazaguanine synthase